MHAADSNGNLRSFVWLGALGLNLMTLCVRPGIADLNAGGSSWEDPVPFAVSGLFFRFGSAQAQAQIFPCLALNFPEPGLHQGCG